jgi:hypothetical protein
LVLCGQVDGLIILCSGNKTCCCPCLEISTNSPHGDHFPTRIACVKTFANRLPLYPRTGIAIEYILSHGHGSPSAKSCRFSSLPLLLMPDACITTPGPLPVRQHQNPETRKRVSRPLIEELLVGVHAALE